MKAHVDLVPKFFLIEDQHIGDYGLQKRSKKDIENDRFVEIWNIVFSQYNAIKGLEREDYP